jgi:hypothetical protein
MPPPTKGADRAHRHDGAAVALLDHPVRRRLHRVEGAVVVDLVGAPHDVARHVEKAVERADAGVAHQHVDLAECFSSGRHQPLAGLGIGHVGLDRYGLAAEGPDLLDDLRPRPRAVVHHHVGTLAGAADGDRAPDPARGTGDDDGLTFEQHVAPPEGAAVVP